MGYYVHNIPGRMRIKIPHAKGNNEVSQSIQDMILAIPGVRSTKANEVTGSILIHYDSNKADPSNILNLVVKEGYFDITKAVTSDDYINDSVEKTARVVSKTALAFVVDIALKDVGLGFLAALI
jgi:hypothetical protein